MKFTILGDPLPLQRARKGKNAFYDPQFQAKQNVAWLVKKQLSLDFEVLNEPLSIYIEFNMPIPKSISRKKHQALIGQPHVQNKDIDNLCKFIFDALNGIVWRDDCLIWKLATSKIYSEEPSTIVKIL